MQAQVSPADSPSVQNPFSTAAERKAYRAMVKGSETDADRLTIQQWAETLPMGSALQSDILDAAMREVR